MTDEQKALVRAVASEVMGWTITSGNLGEEIYCTEDGEKDYKPDFGQEINERHYNPFNPLTLYDSAGLVIGEMEAKGWEFEKSSRGYINGFSRVWFIKKDEMGYLWGDVTACGDGLQAMCEAALEAVRSEKR